MICFDFSKNFTSSKKFITAALLFSCVAASGCRTTNGINKGKRCKTQTAVLEDIKDDNCKSFFSGTAGNKVYFAFDKDDLSAEARSSIARQADCLKKYPKYRAEIEGHCDARGTREYNLALGERRANEVKKNLAERGVECERISTMSYGKERLANQSSTEEAHAQNRRAVTTIGK